MRMIGAKVKIFCKPAMLQIAARHLCTSLPGNFMRRILWLSC